MGTVSIGIDFGTSVVKGTAVNHQTGGVQQITSRYKDRFEQSHPQGWSQVLQRTLEQLTGLIEPSMSVMSLAITGMVPNVSLMAHNGECLGSLLFCDNEAYQLELELDKELKSPPWSNEVLSKIIFLARAKPGKQFRWYSTHNWLVFKLTGRFVLDSVTAGECGNLILAGSGWNHEIIERFGLDQGNFPEIVPPAAIVGMVGEDYPVPALRGVPVAAGTSDTVATALGAGWSEQRGSLLVYYGTFNCAARIQHGRSAVLHGSVPCNPFDWLLSIPKAGTQLEHLADLLVDGPTRGERLDALGQLAAEAPPGCNGLVFLHADDIEHTTVSTVPCGSVRFLVPGHTKSDLLRAPLEGFAYLLRWSFERRRLGADAFPFVMAAGGGAQSDHWRQIVSDVSGLTQCYRPSADRGLGSALLATVALSSELFGKLEHQAQREVRITRPVISPRYDEPYRRYLGTFPSGI